MNSNETNTQNRITVKLRSERGASITFALLLFLVCAALSAVVLVAATTAAGRMSGLAENDQQYYAVTSATELIRDMIGEESVSVVLMGKSKKMFSKPINEITDSDLGISPPTDTDDDVKADSEDNNSDSTLADSLATEIASACINGTTFTKTLSLSSNISNDPLAVNIEETVNTAGNVVFIISDNSSKPFKMLLEFATEIRSDLHPPVTKVKDKEVTEAYEVSWHMTRMLNAYDASINSFN